MLNRRELRIRLARIGEDGNYEPPPVETQADVAAFAGDIAKDLMWEGLKVAVVIITLNTVSKVVVALVEK